MAIPLSDLLVAIATAAAAIAWPALVASADPSCSNARQFSYRAVAPAPGSNPLQTVTAPAASLSACLLLCSLNRHKQCRSVCHVLPGNCIMYSQSEDGFNYQPGNCQILKLYRTDGYEDCRESWVGNRRFCVLQQRVSGSVNFTRPWVDYENGFGDGDNFWTGLKVLHKLTTSTDTGLAANSGGATIRFEMTKWSGSSYYCEYDGLRVGGADGNYILNYTRYAGERSNIAIDALAERSLGMMFSTMDRDNDMNGGSCSLGYGGGSGWWFRSCFYANPNGLFVDSESVLSKYTSWHAIDGNFVSLKSIRIMILME